MTNVFAIMGEIQYDFIKNKSYNVKTLLFQLEFNARMLKSLLSRVTYESFILYQPIAVQI